MVQLWHGGATCRGGMMVQPWHGGTIVVWWCAILGGKEAVRRCWEAIQNGSLFRGMISTAACVNKP